MWHGPTGHAPSLDVLTRLAELYECAVSDLLLDAPQCRDRDSAHQAQSTAELLPSGDGTVDLDGLAARLEHRDTDELAAAVAAWASQTDSGVTRRSLLTLSAGLTLAAADPVFAFSEPAAAADTTPAERTYPGVWLSRYVYPSTGRGAGLRRRTEHTSPTGYYGGKTYHGTLQLAVNDTGRTMTGQWLGFGKDFKINTGSWELHWVDDATSARATRQYALKV